MEKQTIYVLELIHYDYHEFSDLLFASTSYEEILKHIESHDDKCETFNWWELSTEEMRQLYNYEVKHFRISKF